MMNNRKKVTEACSRLLAQKHLTIAFAESATAGSLTAAFACTANSGKILKGAVVCYDAQLKQDILNVPSAMIKQYSAESIQVTHEITKGLKKIIEADIYVGVTGLLKPGGSENKEKPVGTIFTCILAQDGEIFNRSVFPYSEEIILDYTLENICMLLIEMLSAKSL